MSSPAHPSDASIAYRADIDGLRAAAIVSVVMFHAFPSTVPGGFTGVDVFFVISGYLISGLLLKELRGTGGLDLWRFYVRRVNRIFPALVVTLALCAAAGRFLLFPDEYAELGKHTAAGAGFLINFALWREAGYFDQPAETKPLLHLWSLAIEEQFYLLWPGLMLLVSKAGCGTRALALVLGLVSFAVGIAWLRTDPPGAFFLLPGRFWELLAGAWLATHASAESRSARRDGMSIAGAALVLVAAFATRGGAQFPGWWALAPVAGTGILIAAGQGAVVNRVILSRPACAWVGRISYPLYLFHWPMLSLMRITESATPPAAYRALALAISVALAALTYAFLERPIRERKRSASAIGLVLLMAAIAGWGLSIMSRGE